LLIISSFISSFGAQDSIYIKSNRHFDTSQINAYKANPDFSYILENHDTHWWDEIYEWVVNLLSDWLNEKDPAVIGSYLYYFFKALLWTLFLASLGLMAYSLYKNNNLGIIGRKKQILDLSPKELEDKVLETNWQELINSAIDKQQFNVAIRLLFLNLLKSLNHAKLIEWNKSKTIRDYQKELAISYHQEFASLAKYYQYSWFGDVVIDELHFNKVHMEFNTFNQNAGVG